MAEIFYNQEVPEDLRNSIEDELSEYSQIRDTNVIFMKSQTVPELIKILQSAAEWIDPFKIAGSYFLYQLGKTISTVNKKITGNIVDSLWENREEVYEILKDEDCKPIRDLTNLILKTKEETSDQSRIILGFPIPEKYFASNFKIDSNDELEIAYHISKFVKESEKLETTIKAQCGDDVAAGVEIELLDNGNFRLSWQDQDLNKHSVDIEIESAT